MSQPLGWRAKKASYYAGGRMSPGLLRARRPFRTANAIGGALVLSFALSVYFYSISAVKQDDFSDVPLPTPSEIQRLSMEVEEERRVAREAKERAVGVKRPERFGGSVGVGVGGEVEVEGPRWWGWRGQGGPWVMGAPGLDRVGLVKDRGPAEGERRAV